MGVGVSSELLSELFITVVKLHLNNDPARPHIAFDPKRRVLDLQDFLSVVLCVAHVKFSHLSALPQRLEALFRQNLFAPALFNRLESDGFRMQLASSSAEIAFRQHHKILAQVRLLCETQQRMCYYIYIFHDQVYAAYAINSPSSPAINNTIKVRIHKESRIYVLSHSLGGDQGRHAVYSVPGLRYGHGNDK